MNISFGKELNLENRNCVVFGLGKSGLSATQLLKKKDAMVRVISSGNPVLWCPQDILSLDDCISDDDFRAANWFLEADLIILSPGISNQHPHLKLAKEKGIPIWSEIELGLQFINAPVIAVTGTNGKTTTVTLLTDMLAACGKLVFLGGNIGIPLCDHIISGMSVDYIVLELSSFQLENTYSLKAKVAILLNIFDNHAERYSCFEDYAQAKLRILQNMDENDLLIYPEQNEALREWASSHSGHRIDLDQKNIDEIIGDIEKSYSLKKIKIPGEHNIINTYSCLLTLEALKMGGLEVQNVIDEFKGVKHRLEYVCQKNGYDIYNDAKSTNWDATIVALKAFAQKNKPVTLIIGGKRRSESDSCKPFISSLVQLTNKVLLIGESSEFIAKELEGHIEYIICHDLDGVKKTLSEPVMGGVLLFSPAHPSFDQFDSYLERGKCFLKIVEEL